MIIVLSTFPPLARNSRAGAALTLKQSMTNFKAIFSPKKLNIINNHKHFIGIDVSKQTLDIAIHKQEQHLGHITGSNDLKGMKAFEKKAKEWKVDLQNALFCMEYTGSYNYTLVDFLSRKHYAIWVENAVAIKKSLGFQRGKSDRLDARPIAQYAYRFKDKAQLWQPDRAVIRQLKALVSIRERLIKSRASIVQPLNEYKKFMPASYKMFKEGCKATLQGAVKDIKVVEKQLEGLIKADEKLNEQYTIATSLKGIGPVTACQMILCSGEFTKIQTGKQLACYAGVVPFENSSGTSVRGRSKVSHWANKKLKSYLHMAALSAIQGPGELQTYYEGQLAKGKHKMSVLNAVRNKLVLRVCACISSNQLYDPAYSYQAA